MSKAAGWGVKSGGFLQTWPRRRLENEWQLLRLRRSSELEEQEERHNDMLVHLTV